MKELRKEEFFIRGDKPRMKPHAFKKLFKYMNPTN